VLGLQATFRPEEASGVRESYEFRVDDEVLHARVDDGQVASAHGPAWEPSLTITCDSHTFRDLAAGELSPQEAARAGRLAVEGDRRALRRFQKIFRMPERATRGATAVAQTAHAA
jgi:putative sterol carrier protein